MESMVSTLHAMGVTNIFAALSLLISGAAYVVIGYDIGRGSTRPIITTWFIWTIVNVIMFFAMREEALRYDRTLSAQMIAYTVGTACILLLTLTRRGTWIWTRSDLYVLLGAVVALGLWFAMNDPVYALVTSLFATGIGSAPLWIELSRNPKSQGTIPWLMWWIGGLLGLFAVEKQNELTEWIMPITVFAFQCFTIFLIYRPVRASHTR